VGNAPGYPLGYDGCQEFGPIEVVGGEGVCDGV
jgi:hypothetical protein